MAGSFPEEVSFVPDLGNCIPCPAGFYFLQVVIHEAAKLGWLCQPIPGLFLYYYKKACFQHYIKEII